MITALFFDNLKFMEMLSDQQKPSRVFVLEKGEVGRVCEVSDNDVNRSCDSTDRMHLGFLFR